MHQFFNTRSRSGHRQIFQQRSQLHDESDLSCGKIFSDDDRCHESDGDQHIGFDIKGCHQTDDRLENDRHAA